MPRKRLVAAALVACVLAPAAAAHASATQVSIMQDDDQLVYRDDATRDRALDEMKALGVDVVRATVLWRNVAAGVSRSAAARKDLANPRSYGVAVWNRYDNLVRSAQQLGLGVYFSVTGPAPAYAHGKGPKKERQVVKDAWQPSPTQFAKFVTASAPPSRTSQAQPEPNWPTPAASNFSLKSSKEPKAASIAAPRSPSGAPPPSGLIVGQKSEWL